MAGLITFVRLFRDIALITFYILFGRLFPRRRNPPVDLNNKICIVTGANSGIGYSMTLTFARQGATVYLACRSEPKARAAITSILKIVPAATGRLHLLPFDASLLSSARSCAYLWPKDKQIDILCHNAGIGAPSANDPVFTTEGLPHLYVTNFLSSFLLTSLLEPYLSPSVRVILTSSAGSYSSTFSRKFSLTPIPKTLEHGFHSGNAQDSSIYGNSKAMQNVFATLLQQHFDRQPISEKQPGTPTRRIAHAFHPGFVRTEIFNKIPPVSFSKDIIFWFLTETFNLLAEDVEMGAATGVFLATSQSRKVVGEGAGGGFWERQSRRLCTTDLIDRKVKDRMWRRWEADAGVVWQ